jgi:predicted acyl esterase
VSHPYDGAFYHERTPDGSRITVPLLCVANWEDWSTVGYRAAASKSKWLRIETGDHLTPFYSEESFELQKRFFDHFLKGKKDGWDKEPPVSVQIRRPDGTFWETNTTWPLPETQWTRYYLDSGDGELGPDKNGSAAAEKSYAAMSDGLTFKTKPFNEDVEFTGPVALMAPGQIYEVDVNFAWPTSVVVPKGYQLAPNIQGKDWQYPPNAKILPSKDYELPFSTNPGLFFAAHANLDPALYEGTSMVATGAGQASYLLLPLIPSRH